MNEKNIENLSFQAEVSKLLHLVANSLYSEREIFLRELISNSADACEKLRYLSLSKKNLLNGDKELKININVSKKKKIIEIHDNGIGMSRQDLIDNLGTIARSGTSKFIEAMKNKKDSDISAIGQFGVGFYSSFIVAEKVVLITRRAGLSSENGVRWESSGEGEYSLQAIEKIDRGTDIILYLRKGEDDLLNGWQLRSIIRKYSDHISLPIVLKKEEWSEEKKENVITKEDEIINQASALWARPKNEITSEQYDEFYKHVAHDHESPLSYVHTKVEGRQEYTQLLYIPSHAPFDLFDKDRRHGIKLYVQRVFIMDDAEQLMPNYLRFVRGVIDSNNLPLNVSREILQESKDIELIRSGSVKKILGLLEELSKDEQENNKYNTFWKEFGQVLKEGVGEDHTNREQISSLLRFVSTFSDSDEQLVSLNDYVSRMKEGQEKIYFITADSLKAARNSPHLEIFQKKGIEVILLFDRVDEWLASNLKEFKSKSLQSIAKGNLDLGNLEEEEEKKEQEKEANEYKDLTDKIKNVLSEQVKDVRITLRLTESPACLVADSHDMGGNLERLLKSAGQKITHSKPILEINPHHPMVQKLKYEEERFNDWSSVLFDQALLAEGGQLEDPASFVKRLNTLLLQTI